jgi:prepilin-type N-terminal cleavage/methylation domain-containing protein
MNRSLQGFTVIELIVVVGIIAIMAAALISHFDLKSARAEVAADELVTSLRNAQRLAMNRERNTRITFTVATDSYNIDIADTNIPSTYVPAKDPVTQQDWIVNIPARFPGIDLQSVNIAGGSVLIFSETNGIPSDGSGVPLSADGLIQFSSGQKIRITKGTGYVRLE